MTVVAVCRESIVEAVRERWGTRGRWTTADLASLLGVSESRVRGCVGWLVHHGLVVAAGRQWGTTRAGDRYAIACYRWTGAAEVPRKASPPFKGGDWLARPWIHAKRDRPAAGC